MPKTAVLTTKASGSADDNCLTSKMGVHYLLRALPTVSNGPNAATSLSELMLAIKRLLTLLI